MSVVSLFNYIKLEYKIFMYLTLTLCITSTILLFLYFNCIQPHYFIDEAFHISQIIQYCAWNFTQGSKNHYIVKIVYITTAILSLFNMYNITYIRCINLFGMCLNLYLISNIRRENCNLMKQSGGIID